MSQDVFVSYSTADETAAMAIVKVLERQGLSCWVAPRDILPGERWAAAILRGIDSSRAAVLVFSSHSNGSEHVCREVERICNRRIPLVPVRVEQVKPEGEIEYFLSSRQWLEAFRPPLEARVAGLADKVMALIEIAAALGPGGEGRTAGPAEPLVAEPPGDKPRSGGLLTWLAVAVTLAACAAAYQLWPNHGTSTLQPPAPARSLATSLPAANSPHAATDFLGMTLLHIKGGSFLMGHEPCNSDVFDDAAPHQVTVGDFWLGRCHVTRGQFARFIADSGYTTDAEKAGAADGWTGTEIKLIAGANWRDVGFEQADDHPVVLVSWNDATAFCRWATLKDPQHRHYRLPGEAEWEYACRAGTHGEYPWGDELVDGRGWTNATDEGGHAAFGWGEVVPWDDGYLFTSPVGSFRANAFGLCDMVGNAWQWCDDAYAPYGVPPPIMGATDATRFVRRGGSWGTGGPISLKCAFRSRLSANKAKCDVGFRVAVD